MKEKRRGREVRATRETNRDDDHDKESTSRGGISGEKGTRRRRTSGKREDEAQMSVAATRAARHEKGEGGITAGGGRAWRRTRKTSSRDASTS